MRIGGTPTQGLPSPNLDRAAGGSGQDTAFGFDELGGFGVKRPSEAAVAGRPSTPRSAAAPPSHDAGERGRLIAPRVDPEAMAPTLPSLPGPEGDEREASVFEDHHRAPELWSNEPDGRGEVTALIEDGDFELEQGEENHRSGAARAEQPNSTHGLIAATEGGNVTIAVKAPPLDADGRAL